ncbi:MAG: glycosyltransferase family 39 protein, partial [Pseudomonadota bacterium]
MVLAALVRALFFIHPPLLDADMAAIGLLALQVLRGEFPIFFLGQPYAGMLEAYVAAPLMLAWGPSSRTLALAPALLSLLFVWLCYLAVRDMWGRRAGLMAMLLAAAPPYYFIWHNVLPRGCYIEIPLFSVLLVWLAFRLAHRSQAWWLYLAYGLTAGLGFWTHFLISYALLATALYLVLNEWRVLLRPALPLMALGFLVGSFPLWLYNLGHHWATFTYLMSLDKVMGIWPAFRDFLLQAWPTLIGAYWDGTRDALAPVLSQVMWALSAATLLYVIWQRRKGLAHLVRFSTAHADGAELWLLCLAAAVLVTSLKGEPVGSSRRHFVPMYAALIPLAAYACVRLYEWRKGLGIALLTTMLLFNLGGIVANSPAGNPKLRRAAAEQISQRRNFVKALLNKGITRAYGLDYWVCAPLTFESAERLIVVMGADELDHFYEPHGRLVAQTASPAWVGRRDSHFLEASLRNLGATFQKVRV